MLLDAAATPLLLFHDISPRRYALRHAAAADVTLLPLMACHAAVDKITLLRCATRCRALYNAERRHAMLYAMLCYTRHTLC